MINLERLNVQSLILELTRQCNLNCAHCFRGDSEKEYIPLDTIDKVFNDICRVNSFLLTGGEPLLAKKQLKRITEIIMKENINVGDIIIVTNGTVLSFDILGMLFQLSERANLEIRISTDIFHDLELEKQKLVEIQEKNIELLKKYFKVNHQKDKIFIIDKVGRAMNLTDEDLNKINEIESTKYIFSNDKRLNAFRGQYPLPKVIEDNVVTGTLNIDVKGNITPVYYSYDDEEKNSKSNINDTKCLRLAINKIKWL